jgi:hypothetical protein
MPMLDCLARKLLGLAAHARSQASKKKLSLSSQPSHTVRQHACAIVAPRDIMAVATYWSGCYFRRKGGLFCWLKRISFTINCSSQHRQSNGFHTSVF